MGKKSDIVIEQNVSVSALLKRNKMQKDETGKTPISPTNRRKATKRRKKKGIVFAELNGDPKPKQSSDNQLAQRLKQRKEKQENERKKKQMEEEQLRAHKKAEEERIKTE